MMMNATPEIVIYKDETGRSAVEVLFENETLWLSLNQLATLFERDKSVISRHLKNIFISEELDPASVVAKIATTAGDHKVYQVDHYNLDVIISLGYRVNSKRGIQFRQWANQVLKEYLISGYALNERKLLNKGMEELEKALSLLSRTLAQSLLSSDLHQKSIYLIKHYVKSWKLLRQYDDHQMSLPSGFSHEPKSLEYGFCQVQILDLKKQLMSRGEATDIFGVEKSHGLQAILGNIDQTFDGQPLYNSLQARAAHLLYFVIKDHPFHDGNKRIGSFLFLLYLALNDMNLDKMNDSLLVALALLVAESRPSEKEFLTALIINLITQEEDVAH